MYVIYIFSLTLFARSLGSDFEVNSARATRHLSRDVSSQAFTDFKNAHNYAQRGRPIVPRQAFEQ